MTGHGIVPKEATEAMKLSGARSIGATIDVANHTVRASQCWQAMLAAAPRYEIGDAEVERVAAVLHSAQGYEGKWTDEHISEEWRNEFRSWTRAALEAFRDGLEGR